MNKTTVPIHANVCLISEMPRVALFCLMSIGIALFFLVLRRRRRCDQRRIHDRPFHQDQTVLLQRLNKVGKQLFLKPVLCQYIPEPPDGISIRYLVARLHAAEP